MTKDWPWAAAQTFVGLAMASSIMFLVTGLLAWWVLNLTAAAIALATAWVPAWQRAGSVAALVLYGPFNLAIGLVNLQAAIPALLAYGLVVPAAQVALVVWVWRTNPSKSP